MRFRYRGVSIIFSRWPEGQSKARVQGYPLTDGRQAFSHYVPVCEPRSSNPFLLRGRKYWKRRRCLDGTMRNPRNRCGACRFPTALRVPGCLCGAAVAKKPGRIRTSAPQRGPVLRSADANRVLQAFPCGAGGGPAPDGRRNGAGRLCRGFGRCRGPVGGGFPDER